MAYWAYNLIFNFQLSILLITFVPMNSSLYIHIPFCKKLCGYCDFFKTISLAKKSEVLARIAEEMRERAPMLADTSLKTIYFGGGTPTVCTPEELGCLLRTAEAIFDCSQVEEVTVEANPDDLTDEYLAGLRKVGVNRLSIGIQSFRNEDLQMMNRRHNASQAIEAVQRARKAGFENISIDLIYGLPTATLEEWRDNVSQAIALGVEHISAYHLTIEENTLFGKKGVTTAPEELSDKEYEALCEMLHKAGYEHYEISNFALPTRRSRHNSAYWRGTPYLGLGPGAHSFDGKSTRSWNPASLKTYLEGAPAECENLSYTERYEEVVMVSLRTVEGVDLVALEAQFGREKVAYFIHRAEPFLRCGILTQKGQNIAFEEPHWLISDGVIAELF